MIQFEIFAPSAGKDILKILAGKPQYICSILTDDGHAYLCQIDKVEGELLHVTRPRSKSFTLALRHISRVNVIEPGE